MTREEVIIPEMNLKNIIAESREVAQALNEFADNLEQIEKKYAEPREKEKKWIPLIKKWSDNEGAMIFNCPLPEDGQEVLVSHGGYVYIDTFCEDDGWCDFEGVNIDNVEAWMPLTEPYRAESEGVDERG